MRRNWESVESGWHLNLVTAAASGETIRTYTAYVRVAYASLGDSLLSANPEQLASFLAAYGVGHSRNAVRNMTSALRSFFRYCRSRGWRQDDPTAGFSLKKPRLQAKRPFSTGDLRRMFAVAVRPVDRLMLLLLTGTGMRIGEMVSLCIEDIDFEDGIAVIRGKGGKEGWVVLSHVTLSALREYIGLRKLGPVLLTREGKPMSRERARKRIMAVAQRAGVPKCYPHRFRTSYANGFLDAGGDLDALQIIMRHERIETTAHYAGRHRAQRALSQMRRFDLTAQLVD